MIPLPQHRNLKELLKEEQEPFHKQNPRQNASFPSNFRRNACFCSTCPSSPDPFRKSLFFRAVNRNPSDALFLHVPPKTASLLLEAALRVHNNSKSKPKPRIPSSGFGLLNSLIKRLRIRTRIRIPKTGNDDVVRWAASTKTSATSSNTSSSSSSSFSSSFCSTTTVVTANELEEEEEEEIGFVKGLGREDTTNNGHIGYGDFPSSCRMSPAFSSPAMSPSRPIFQENANYEQKLQNPALKSLVEDYEEDREQTSPVSILDPPVEDDDCAVEEDEKRRTEDKISDLECSYTFSQRAKRRVLLKLQKFEDLAELDPTKLEDKMVDDEEEGDEYDDLQCEVREDDDLPSTRHGFERNIDNFLVDVSCDLRRSWMKRLVSDVISEEERLINRISSSGEINYNKLIAKRVCMRFESWREVEANTIDMMIGIDFRGESDGKWKKQAEDDDISWAATEVEFSIFAGLVDELLHEFESALN